jgi:hypothetical protein
VGRRRVGLGLWQTLDPRFRRLNSRIDGLAELKLSPVIIFFLRNLMRILRTVYGRSSSENSPIALFFKKYGGPSFFRQHKFGFTPRVGVRTFFLSHHGQPEKETSSEDEQA